MVIKERKKKNQPMTTENYLKQPKGINGEIKKLQSLVCTQSSLLSMQVLLTAYSLRKSSVYGNKSQNSIFSNRNTNIIPLSHSYIELSRSLPLMGNSLFPITKRYINICRSLVIPTQDRNHKALGQNIN